MKVKFCNAIGNTSLYTGKRFEIVSIYNNHSPTHSESPSLDIQSLSQPNLLHAFYCDNVKGGLLVEQLTNNNSLAIITFVAIEKKHQKKGIGKALITTAKAFFLKKGILLAGVQLNQFDDRAFWYQFDFMDEIDFMNGKALISRELQ